MEGAFAGAVRDLCSPVIRPVLGGLGSTKPALWLTERFRARRKRGMSPNEWRCQWPDPSSPQSEW